MFVQPAQGFPPQGQFLQPRQPYAQPRQQFVPPQQLPPPPPGFGTPRSAPAQQAAGGVRPPVVRAKIDDTPPQAAAPAWNRANQITLPSPEQLGVVSVSAAPRAVAATDTLDWNAARTRLRQAGALSFQSTQLPQGGWRFTCLLPTAQPNHARHVEATGATEAEAIRLALASIEGQTVGR